VWGEGLLVHAQAISTVGVHLAVPPVRTLPHGSSEDEIGAAVCAMLDAHRVSHPPPRDWKAFSTNFLKAAGVMSWRVLQKNSRCCSIDRTPTVIRIVPTRNGGLVGDDKGFHDLDGLVLDVPVASTPSAIGAALLSAFERCR
jgi:hypothetical protein